MISRISILFAVLFCLQGLAKEAISTSDLTDPKLKSLAEAFRASGLNATDRYSDAYRFSQAPDGDDVADRFEDPYIEGYEMNLVDSDGGPVATAEDLAKELFTADPYQNSYSYRGIDAVEDAILALPTADSGYAVYAVYSWGPFHGTHYSIVATSQVSKEMLDLTTGYSE